jgi:hypothetical protein
VNKAQTIHSFWSGFGLKAYDENTIPTGDNSPDLPYITYSVSTDSLGNPVSMYGNIYDRSTSWKLVEDKAEEIAKAIVNMQPPTLKFNDGRIYITKGTPFSQRMSDASNDTIRRLYINISVEYLSAY